MLESGFFVPPRDFYCGKYVLFSHYNLEECIHLLMYSMNSTIVAWMDSMAAGLGSCWLFRLVINTQKSYSVTYQGLCGKCKKKKKKTLSGFPCMQCLYLHQYYHSYKYGVNSLLFPVFEQKYPEHAIYKVLHLMLRRGELQHRMQRKVLYRVKQMRTLCLSLLQKSNKNRNVKSIEGMLSIFLRMLPQLKMSSFCKQFRRCLMCTFLSSISD